MEKRLSAFNWITLGVCFIVALFGLAQLGFLVGYFALARDVNFDKIGYTPIASVFAGVAAVYLFIRTMKNTSSSTDIKSQD